MVWVSVLWKGIRDWGESNGGAWTENWDMAFLRGMARRGC